MRSLGQPALLKTFEVWQRMSESGAAHQAHSGPDLTHSSQLGAELGQRGPLAPLEHTRSNSRYRHCILAAILQHKKRKILALLEGKAKVIHIKQNRSLALSPGAFGAAAVF